MINIKCHVSDDKHKYPVNRKMMNITGITIFLVSLSTQVEYIYLRLLEHQQYREDNGKTNRNHVMTETCSNPRSKLHSDSAI